MTTISPLLQQRIANQQVAPVQPQVQAPVNLEQKPDTVEISKEAHALEKTEARELKSSSKGITITTDGNTINVSFKNTAYLYGAVMRGYIDIGNGRFIFDDDILYPHDLLEYLINAHIEFPDCICSNWIRFLFLLN